MNTYTNENIIFIKVIFITGKISERLVLIHRSLRNKFFLLLPTTGMLNEGFSYSKVPPWNSEGFNFMLKDPAARLCYNSEDSAEVRQTSLLMRFRWDMEVAWSFLLLSRPEDNVSLRWDTRGFKQRRLNNIETQQMLCFNQRNVWLFLTWSTSSLNKYCDKNRHLNWTTEFPEHVLYICNRLYCILCWCYNSILVKTNWKFMFMLNSNVKYNIDVHTITRYWFSYDVAILQSKQCQEQRYEAQNSAFLYIYMFHITSHKNFPHFGDKSGNFFWQSLRWHVAFSHTCSSTTGGRAGRAGWGPCLPV